MLILDICDKLGFLNIMRFVKILLNFVCIIVPVGLIIMLSIDFSKNVMHDDAFQKKNNKVIIQRLISAVLLFAVPYIIKVVMTGIVGLGGDWATCYTNASKEKMIEVFNEKYNGVELNGDLARELSTDIDYLDNGSLKDSYKSKLNKYYEDKKAAAEKNRSDNKKNSGSSNNGGSSSKPVTPSTKSGKYIFIGDSRTVGLCAVVTGDYNGCNNSSNSPKSSGDDIFIAKVGEGYSWFSSTAISSMNNIIKSNSGTTYNIIINMGVNDLGNISSYINKYNELKKTYSNHNIVIVSVNPVWDARAKYVKNQGILDFNSKLKSGLDSGIKYCDTYSDLISSLQSSDYDSEGLHYSNSAYKKIYDSSKTCA